MRVYPDTGSNTMNNSFNVFLDLEDTVLDDWESGLLVNTEKVKTFLHSLSVTEFTVFSFAVWDESDVEVFNQRHKSLLETSLQVKVKSCPTLKDFMSADVKHTGVRFVQLHEFISVRGKVDAFRTWCDVHYPDQNCVLVDDTVPNLDLLNRDSGRVLRYVNVHTL
jgi:hypothetical protein